MTTRHTPTKAYLKQALINLLTEKSFEAITVSDLTKKLVSIEAPFTCITGISMT